jgi:outer membrane protein assembly factor BamB
LIILQKLDGTQVGEATFGASKGQLLSLSPELTIYLCGNPSFDEQHAECAAFDARSRLAQWTFKLREHGRAAGGFWKEGRLYLTTTGGMVYAIAENKSQVVVTAEQLPLPESNPPLAPGVVWSYSITETIRSGPEVVADGKIYFLTIENEMHVISAEGHLLNVIPLPAGPFIMEGSWGESYPLWPLIFSDGSMVVISEKQTVYALDAQGNLLWETPLEARPYRYPMRTEQDTFYLTDKKGGLYAFGTRGLRWSFHATVAPYTASGLTVAQDGTIYYTVTNYSNGYLQAVSAEGQGLWATRTKTDMFYDEPLVSPEGRLVFVKDNVFDAQTGELLTIEFPLRVDELIIGMDGHLYLRTDHTITEWRIGEQGFEIVQQAEWGARTRGAAPPYYTVVDKNSAIWLTYGGNIVWIKPDGTVLGVHRRANSSGQIYQPDYENTLLTECNYFALDKSFDCATFTPQAEEPIWKVTIAGLPSHEYTFIQGRYAYVMGKDHMLYKTYLGEP